MKMIQLPIKRPLHKGAALLTAASIILGSVVWSQVTAHADSTPPPAPLNFRASPSPTSTDGHVALTWDASPAQDVSYYQIFRHNNATAATANELTFVGRTEDARTFYIETVSSEGTFHYAVIAVDQSANASQPSSWTEISIDLPANGPGVITPDQAPPAAVSGLVAGAESTAARTLKLNWAASPDTDLWRYLVYRQVGSEAARMVAYVPAGTQTFIETVPANGTYSYYLIAQDKAGNASAPSASAVAVATDSVPSAPTGITAPEYSKTRAVTLSWLASLQGTVTQYQVYRSSPGVAAVAVGTTLPTILQFVDTVPADGVYTYYVVAENGALVSPASLSANVHVDTVAPSFTITSPEANKTYEKKDEVSIQVEVTDAGSGQVPSKIKYLLDGQPLSSAKIDLEDLLDGQHLVTIEVADKAGNQTVASVAFTVAPALPEDEDEDEDDDEDDRSPRQDLIDLLNTLRAEIHHGHFNALMAKARAGNIKSFVDHASKHQGKFLTKNASEKLLKAAGAETEGQTFHKSGHSKKGHKD